MSEGGVWGVRGGSGRRVMGTIGEGEWGVRVEGREESEQGGFDALYRGEERRDGGEIKRV